MRFLKDYWRQGLDLEFRPNEVIWDVNSTLPVHVIKMFRSKIKAFDFRMAGFECTVSKTTTNKLQLLLYKLEKGFKSNIFKIFY